MNEAHQNEIKNMTNEELAAAINITRRQMNAPLFIGDREERRVVNEALNAERIKRGF